MDALSAEEMCDTMILKMIFFKKRSILFLQILVATSIMNSQLENVSTFPKLIRANWSINKIEIHILVYSNSQVKSIIVILKIQICPKAMDAIKWSLWFWALEIMLTNHFTACSSTSPSVCMLKKGVCVCVRNACKFIFEDMIFLNTFIRVQIVSVRTEHT